MASTRRDSVCEVGSKRANPEVEEGADRAGDAQVGEPEAVP
jgi:hypothetical protein